MPSPLAKAIHTYVSAVRSALGDQYGTRRIVQVQDRDEPPVRVLQVLDIDGHIAIEVSVDTGYTFHHPHSAFWVGMGD